jgi:hypothetical protein
MRFELLTASTPGTCAVFGRGGRNRAGLSLIEAIAALLILSVGVVSLAGAAGVAARLLRDAALEQGAVHTAATVIDSLADAPAAATGSIVRGPYTIEWNAVDTAGSILIDLDVSYSAGGRAGHLHVGRFAGPPPLRFGNAP